MQNKQMEIGFTAQAVKCRRPLRSHQRRLRAQWWFNQMRQVVEAAYDWKNAPARPEQKELCLAQRGR